MQRAQQAPTALVPALVVTLASAAWAVEPLPLPPPPDVLFGELFEAVQLAELFADQKVFPDAVPLFEPEQILSDYAA